MKIQLDVALLPQLLSSECERLDDSTLGIVIDTLRFTTTACQALKFASSITVASEVTEARELKHAAESSGSIPPLLCGERHCTPIEGFDLGNSPHEYQQEKIHERELVFTTTNGTRAVRAIEQASQIWLGALVNRKAVVDEVVNQKPNHIVMICSGTEGVVSQEDALTAGAIAAGLQSQLAGCELQLNDSALLCLNAWEQASSSAGELSDILRLGIGGRNLVTAGYDADIHFAAQVDSLAILPRTLGQKHVFGL